jgi:hypothetical protein
MSDTQRKCEACGVSLMAPPAGITTFPADTLCGQCARAGVVWAAKQARRAQFGGHDIDPATGQCRICRTKPTPELPPGFRKPVGCGRPDCPRCNPKPAAVEGS